MTFPTKVDAWLVLAAAGGIAAALAGAVAALETNPIESLIGFGVTAFMVLLVFLVGVPCEYTLADDHLLIRSGVVRWRIPYADITDVAPSRSLWAAPAMSLTRAKVSYRGRFQLVSPAERERFIDELRARVARAKTTA
ncbi:MAG: PH domain-containing protein [Steroidobacteraceae bacterium]|jgi:hypothetical protein|nr:PH domain-containing protein [Steroidobacteraceae bacterium]